MGVVNRFFKLIIPVETSGIKGLSVVEKKVLIIEDDAITRVVLTNYLEQMGFEQILTTDNSEEAIKLIESEKPDIMFVDIIINGEKDGVEVMETAALPKPVHFAFTTASTDRSTLNRAMATNPNDLIRKPYDFEDIKKFVSAL